LLLSGVALVRIALRQLLSEDGGIAVVGEAGTWTEALSAASRSNPDVALMDMQQVHLSLLDRLHEFYAVAPDARVIVLSEDQHGQEVFRAIRAGVWGYLPRDVVPGELVRAVRTVAQGKAVLGCALSRDEFARLGTLRGRDDRAAVSLSPKETRVMRAMAEGCTDSQIARQLAMSVPTVKTHVRSILKKTGSKNRAAAIASGFRHGLLP